MRPNIRQVGNSAAIACAWCGQTRWRHSSVTISFRDFSARHAKRFSALPYKCVPNHKIIYNDKKAKVAYEEQIYYKVRKLWK